MTRQPERHACTRRQALTALTGASLAPASVWSQSASGVGDNDRPSPRVGGTLALPDIELLDGTTFRAGQADGHVLVLYWWASWCPFCAQQSPHMDKLWVTHKSRGLRMLGLSIDRKADDASSYLTRKGYTFPAALVTPSVARVLPKPKGLPVTIVRGRDGRVLAAETGQLFPEDVEQIARYL
jgi:hypothetical protein